MNKAKIILSAEAERCPYWDTESNRPTHTCNGCAEPDNPLNAMIDGVRYCLLDIDITGEICRKNVPDTNVGKNDRWIPVTERLPEEGKNVLGWIERDKWDNFDKPTKAEECAIGWQIEGRWHFDGYSSRGTKCLAWRPLPEPYTAGKQN